MKKMTGAWLLVLAAFPALAWAGTPVAEVNHFDSPEEVARFLPQLKQPETYFDTQRKALGKGAVTGHRFQKNFPEDQDTGCVITFYFYDDEFEVWRDSRLPTVNVRLVKEVDGKKVTVFYELRRWQDHWRLYAPVDLPGVPQYYGLTEAPNHSGWTRLDIVNPGKGGDGRVAFYMDGHEIFRTPEAYRSVAWIDTSLYQSFDEYSYNPDPKTFRPNPVARIMPEREFDTVLAKPGEKLRVGLTLNPAGAGAAAGQVELVALDGRGGEKAKATATVDWKTVGAGPFSLELPPLPRSGYYWLEARYAEPGRHPDATSRKINLQYGDPAVTDFALAPIPLSERFWDFLPNGELGKLVSGPNQANPPTEADFTPPDAAPGDWGKSWKLRGEWMGAGWSNPGLAYYSAWYRQKIAVPAAWQGKRVKLLVDDPHTYALVFANGKRMESVEWPGGVVDLTSAAVPGAELDLAIYVKPDPYFSYYRVGREIAGDAFRAPTVRHRGLRGDVVLYPESAAARIDGVALRPSVTKQRLEAVFECAGLEPGRQYALEGEASLAGRTVKALPRTVFTADAATQNVTVAAEWTDPVLWDLGAPHLYDFTARLADAGGKVVDRIHPERFGFREVGAKGPAFRLNGRPLTLGMNARNPVDTPWFARYADAFNVNAFYHFEGVKDARLLDEMGLTGTGERIYYETSLQGQMLVRLGKEADPRYWREVERVLTHLVKMRRNRPSVFFQRGVLGGGRNGNGGMYNPYFANGTWFNILPDNAINQNTAKLGERVLALLRRLDPSRVVTAQDSGSVNDTRHITEYPGFKAMQEIIEEGLYWKRISSKPFFISEQAAPMYPNWTDACSQGKGWMGVPCFQEWAAITRGDAAYPRDAFYNAVLTRLEKSVRDQREAARKKAKTPAEYEFALSRIRMTSDNMLMQLSDDAPLHSRITRERTLEQAFFNRAHHVGLINFQFTSGPTLGSLYREVFAPVTGFLAGTSESITLKNHIFRPGERFERGALLLNNTPKPEPLTCVWKLELGGVVVGSGTRTETVPAGGQLFVPFAAEVPEGGDRSGTLSVSFVRDGKELRSDQCPVEVVAPRAFENRWRIALVDPEGETARQFDRLGIRYQPLLFDEDVADYDLVVYGRRAFNYEYEMLAEGLDLGKLTQAGKRVLVMEQEEKVLRDRFKLRTEYSSSRMVYGRTGGHPLFAGLADELLRNWRGTATLTDGYEVARAKRRPGPGEFGNGGTWKYLWNDDAEHPRPIKWGNTHNVATVTVIKPDGGNFRTLADCEYASNYAAAWELENGLGRIVFNQLDVSGRTERDPAAERYLMNLVAYSASAADAPKRVRVPVYMGGEKGAALATFLDLKADTVATPPTANPEQTLLVLGEFAPAQLAARKEALAEYARRGGLVFSLAKEAEAFAAGWTPFAVKAEKRTINQTLVGKPAEPLLAGLGNADFLWKGNVAYVALDGLPANAFRLDTGLVARVPHGEGAYILCQADPSLFGNVELDHWLKDSKRTTERMIRTLLTNLGCRQPEPGLLAPPRSAMESLFTIDLAGDWQAAKGALDVTDAPTRESKDWRPLTLPGSPQQRYADWRGLKGRFWYRRELDLTESLPPESVLRMLIGCVSGENILYVNGEKAAVTDTESDVNTVATMVRDYLLPARLFRQGKNELLLRVDYETRAALGLANSNGEVLQPFTLQARQPRTRTKLPAAIDLAGREWWGHWLEGPDGKWNQALRKRLQVPATVQPQYGEWGDKTGYFRYWREVKLAEPLPPEAKPVLMMGSVDDEDTTFFNGVQIGHIGKDTNPDNYWAAPRAYPIPPELFKVGTNRIEVVMRDFNVGGGIATGPVAIVFEDPAVTRQRKLSERPYFYDVGRTEDPYWHHGF